MSSPWLDTPQRYGLVSRALHWGMAAVFAWQFTGMAVRILVGRHPVTAFMVGSHASVGTLLMLLVLLRGAWGLANARRRPRHAPGLLGRLATAGHLLLYAMMLVVPSWRCCAPPAAAGASPSSASRSSPFQGGPVAWMVAPANAAHGLLAWTLLALVAGHMLMVVVHRWLWRDDVLQRMAGRLSGSASNVQQQRTAA
ncbi:cytochrome b [Pseudoroseomonas wenyumeiae]